jgi:DNA-directed RNA polymerase specialized sigma24 family protein
VSEPEGSETVPDRFMTTRWDDVLAARDPQQPGAREAVAGLCRVYWYPLYAFARRKGNTAEYAEDLTQGFFTNGLARDFLRGIDPARGRFRSFLLKSFVNYMKNQHTRKKSVKRGGQLVIVSIDAGEAETRYLLEPSHVEAAERLYDRRWALTVIDRALDRLELKMNSRGKGLLFDRLRTALLGADATVAYAKIAEELAMTEGAVKVAAHRMRDRLGLLIREEISLTVGDPSELDDEIQVLFAALRL